MGEPVLSVLIWMPIVVAILATAVVWRTVRQRALFFVLAALCLLGLQSLVSPGAVGYFLSFSADGTNFEAFERSVLAGSLGVLVVGVPLLAWLHGALRKSSSPGRTFAGSGFRSGEDA